MGFLTGKTAIITGGGRAVLSDGSCGSIGYGIATAYAKEGANLVLTGRNVKKLEDAKAELESKYGIKVLAVQADVNAGADNESVVKNVVEQTVKEFGRMCSSTMRRHLHQALPSQITQQHSLTLPYIQVFTLHFTICRHAIHI